MASRTALAGWLAASLAVAACSFQRNGLGAGVDEAQDGGGLIGMPGTGGLSIGGSPGMGTGGTGGTGGSATGGDPGTGGSPALDAAPAPPDAAVVPTRDTAPLPPDAPPLPSDTAPLPRDAAPPTAGIACGALMCVVGKQACCSTGTAAACIQINGACPGGSVIRCDGPEDCDGGGVCCLVTLNGAAQSFCLTAVQCAQSAGAAICRSGADCASFARNCTGVSGSTISVCR